MHFNSLASRCQRPHRVEIEQVAHGSAHARRVIDLHKLKLRPALRGAQRQTTDTTKTRTYLDSHKNILVKRLKPERGQHDDRRIRTRLQRP
jgi:hypothetical protein